MRNPILWENDKAFAITNEKQIGTEFIFSIEDKDFVEDYRWRRHRDGHVCTNTATGIIEYAHILLLGKKAGYQIDHINRNPCDNRRENLRFVTPRENSLNKESVDTKIKKFGFIGISAFKDYFRVFAHFDNKGKYIGSFPTKELAALAYDFMIISKFGADKTTNYSLGLYDKDFLKAKGISKIEDILLLDIKIPDLEEKRILLIQNTGELLNKVTFIDGAFQSKVKQNGADALKTI